MGTRWCRTRRLAALAAALAVCSGATIGCSGDDESAQSPGDEQSVDEVAASWGEIAPRDEERTRTYLAGAGAPLTEYISFAVDLDERLDDAAYEDGCSDLEAEWASSYERRQMLGWLYELPDPILGRLLTSQIPATEQVLAECAAGNRDESAAMAEQVGRLQELVDRRLEQLEVAP